MATEKSSIKAWIAAVGSVKQGEKNSGLAKAVLRCIAKPRRSRATVSISKLNLYANDNENVVVPGKVLAVGMPSKKYGICAMEYSEEALQRLKKAGCSVVEISDMLNRDGVRLIV